MRLVGLGKLKKKQIHITGTRTRNLEACSIVPQPIMLPRAPDQCSVSSDLHIRRTRLLSKQCLNRDSTDSNETKAWKTGVRLPTRTEIFLFPTASRPRLVPAQPLIQWVPSGSICASNSTNAISSRTREASTLVAYCLGTETF
jgi:hypothetical protein